MGISPETQYPLTPERHRPAGIGHCVDVADVVVELLSDRSEHLGAARELLEQYIRLPDAWERHGGVQVELPGVFSAEIAGFPGAAQPPTGDVAIAVVDGTVVAAGHIVPAAGSEACEFKRVFVDSSHRRAGLGARVAGVMIVRAVALGYRRVLVDVMPERAGAIAFWERLAFEPCEPYRDYGFPMVFMERQLGDVMRGAR
jgi:GNAT superfamily N-acetyltransferase